MDKLNCIKLSSWNRWATRFVAAPTWSWEAVPGAACYVVDLAGVHDTARRYRLQRPYFDMAPFWEQLHHGPVDLLIQALDAQDNALCSALHLRVHKVPGFAGDEQEPLAWVEAVRRNLAYLLAPARDPVADYEQGLPRSCWSSFEDSVTGQRVHLAYPALHHPSFILAFLTFAQRFPDDPLAPEARRQARQYGDWLLQHRLPADWMCSLFPYSTIQAGRFEGGIEGKNITLFRAARVGEAMLALYAAFGDAAYLDYARHLADVFVRLQREDGSWPYRVDPRDGAVVESYTSNAITPARLFGLLEEIAPNARYAQARRRAAQWVLDNPVQTRLWQGMYEDVGEHEPYQNLQHWDTNETIRYLVHYRREVPQAVETAAALNRYIEDQFVVWQQEESPVTVQCPTPAVLEQYLCYYPMEVHTGNWLLSLVALHQATGDGLYLHKGMAAANAIVRGQQANGAFSTWGNDRRFGRPLNTRDWPGCNACAVTALLRWDRYYRGAQAGEPEPLGLWGI
ncbi:MAG: hypothetical protein KatS3mg051_1881 [Anaerolineae bacterium]|nr:MAG: hypothetical protein KatS3mg051_1881 [Anaerolineae bacterium]